MKNTKLPQLLFSRPLLPLCAIMVCIGCAKDVDTEGLQPKIDIVSPVFCDTIYFDEPSAFIFKITDPGGDGLGNLSMDVHHNFNHHTHGDHLTCDMDHMKEPFYPYENVWIFSLPEDEAEYVLETEITIPSSAEGKENTYHDPGDYHFHIYITNINGYQTFTTLDFKLIYRNGHPDDPWQ